MSYRFSNLSGIAATPIMAELVLPYVCTLSNGASRTVLSVWHFWQTTSPALGVLATLFASIKAVLDVKIKACLNEGGVAGAATIKWLDESYFPPTGVSFYSDGTVTGQRLPLYNTLYLKFGTNFSGRNYMGGKHLAPISESSTESDNFVSGAITNNDALATAVLALNGLDGGNGTLWNLVVLSPTLSDFSASPRVFTGADVVACTASAICGTMRRRKEKTGVS